MSALPSPSKIVCIGRNYREHAAELGNAVPPLPIFFLKPSTALIGPGEAIELPPQSAEVHHEAEIALVIGRRARDVEEADAWDYIDALTILNDVTARDIQRAENRFTKAKGFDTFCPVSDARLPASQWAEDIGAGRIQCFVDAVRKQDGALSDMVFGPAFLLSYVSKHMTLLPGELRVSWWTKLLAKGASKIELAKSVHKYCSDTILQVFGTKAPAGSAPAVTEPEPEKKTRKPRKAKGA